MMNKIEKINNQTDLTKYTAKSSDAKIIIIQQEKRKTTLWGEY